MIRSLKKKNNEDWINELLSTSPLRDKCIVELREIIKKSLRFVLHKKNINDEFLLEDITQEAILKIIDKIDSFRGESAFTTWAIKVAVRLTLDEIRKRQWNDISLDDLAYSKKFVYTKEIIDKNDGPEKVTLKRNIVSVVNTIIAKELTMKQRRVLQAIKIHEMPIQEVAHRIGIDRNTLYKNLHDARMKLKECLLKRGITIEDINEIFS